MLTVNMIVQGTMLKPLFSVVFCTIQHRRCLQTSSILCKNLRTGKPKITRARNKPLTYEQVNPPFTIGVRKAWNSWNTSSLHEESAVTSQTTVEDILIRKFMYGTWHNLLLSETIIKRQHNIIRIAVLIHQGVMARKMYFLIGYTEEVLAYILKRPVKLELQTIKDRKDVVFKYI